MHRSSDGFEVLSTIDTPDAAGTLIDTALTDHITTLTTTLPDTTTAPTQPPTPVVVDGRLVAVARARAARDALAHTPAVAVPTTTGPAVILDQATLHALTQPILAHAADTARAAITAADVTVEQLAGVYLLGSTSHLPWAGAAVGETLGVTPTLVADPDRAAVLGAVHATGTPAATPPVPPTPPGRPGLRHYAAAVIPLIASWILLYEVTTLAIPLRMPETIDRNLQVLANWGGYAVAALLAVHAAVAVGLLAATHLGRSLDKVDPDTPNNTGRLLGQILPAVAVTGVTLAGLYGSIAALWWGVPNSPFLRWSVYPTLPVAAAVAAIGLLAARRHHPQHHTWLDWLHFPVTATILAAAGIYLIGWGRVNLYPGQPHVLATYLGAALFGTATALTLPGPLAIRVLATAPLALIAAVLAAADATGTLAGLYILTTTARWTVRTGQLLTSPRTPPNPKPHQ